MVKNILVMNKCENDRPNFKINKRFFYNHVLNHKIFETKMSYNYMFVNL